jgi:hypothetical protein
MIRRIILLLTIAAIGWYAVTRLLRPKEVPIGDELEPWPDEQQEGFAERVTEKASGAVAVTRRAAQAPVARIRSIIGEHGPDTPEAEAGADATADVERQAADGSSAATATSSQPGTVAVSQDGGDGQTADSTGTQTGTVKGNINRDGEKIYHLPGDPAYERTKPERMFASAEEAEAAGYRRAGHRNNG